MPADSNCRHCKGKGYYFLKEDDMEICDCVTENDEE